MYVLYLAVRELGLRTMAFTLDNGYLTEHARRNIDRACRILGVEHVYYAVDPMEMNRLFALFLRKTGTFCSVCMRAIGMATELAAGLHDIPLVLGGSSSRTELPLTRKMFQSGPAPFISRVLKGEPMVAGRSRFLYTGTLKRRLGYRMFWWGSQKRIRLCAWINLPDYVEWKYDTIYRILREELGWTVPEEETEHSDCAIHPVTTLLHNRRFPGLEIGRLTLARLVQAGQITREEALRILAQPAGPDCPEAVLTGFLERLNMTRAEFESLVDRGPRHLCFQPRPNPLRSGLGRAKRAVFKAAGRSR